MLIIRFDVEKACTYTQLHMLDTDVDAYIGATHHRNHITHIDTNQTHIYIHKYIHMHG